MEPIRDIVVIGGSQGSLDAIRQILAGLPMNFPAAILIVVHTGPSSPRFLASIFNTWSVLPVTYGEDGAAVRPGHVYLAPPDQHLEILAPGVLHLSNGPKVNFSRPAADRLFETAAAIYGARVISLVLSGNGSDGAIGAKAVGLAGGLCLVQDPGDAVIPTMPIEAIEKDHPDAIVRLRALVEALNFAVTTSSSPR